jgi:proline dehydrogenase
MNSGILSSHSYSHNHVLMERLLMSLVKKWAAGSSMEDAIVAAKNCNLRGQRVILNCLGEEYTEENKVNQVMEEYSSLLGRLYLENVEGSISVKLSQLGLSISHDLCLKNLKSLVRRAKEFDKFVWIDMESSKYTDDTLMIYFEMLRSHRGIGVVLQSALRRSASDLLHLIEVGGIVRLVKGAYHENEQIAFTSPSEVKVNYTKLLDIIFDSSHTIFTKVNNDDIKFAIATHDSYLVDYAIRLSRVSGFPKNNFEFEFLKGIRDDLKRSLVGQGFIVAEYVPYGDEWLSYSIRRLRERKRNLFLLARSLVQS